MDKIILSLLLVVSVLPNRTQHEGATLPPDNRETGQMTHVQGIVRQGFVGNPGVPVPMFPVTFQTGAKAFTAESNSMGEYEIDLPAGLYTMMISTDPQQRSKEIYRPLFLADGSSNLTLDVTVPEIEINCDFVDARDADGAPLQRSCTPVREALPQPSENEVPFEILVKYQSKKMTGQVFAYNEMDWGAGISFAVEISYNLFSVSADTATYDRSSHVIEASGHVVATWADGPIKRGDVMKFKLENGQARLLP